MNTCKPTLKNQGTQPVLLPRLRYPCIVGAGRNAAILHYERNTAVVGPQDLVLVDAGK